MTTASDERAETWRPAAPLDGCTFSGYEVSDKGQFRSIDRKVGNRSLRGQMLATRRNDDGYVLVNLRCDSADPAHSRRHTLTAHKVVLTTFDRPRPAGMEACHSDRGPAFNWWPEGVRWDGKPANEADKAAAGTQAAEPPATCECVNHERCGGMVKTAGRRCLPCVRSVGAEAAVLLGLGMPLQAVAERYGYSGGDWVFKLAVEHGGYQGTKAAARTQRPGLRQRVTLRHHLRKAHA